MISSASPVTRSTMIGSTAPSMRSCSGAVATMRLLGQMLSMAVATVVFTLIMGTARIEASNLHLFLQSARIVFIVFTFLCVAGIYFSLARGRLRGG